MACSGWGGVVGEVVWLGGGVVGNAFLYIPCFCLTLILKGCFGCLAGYHPARFYILSNLTILL